VPELSLLLQSSLPGENSLEDLLKPALATDDPQRRKQLQDHLLDTARGLAALHGAGVREGKIATWDERMREILVLVERLAIAAPQLRRAVEPLRKPLHELALAHAVEPVVPTHGTFSPEQVLLDARGISFIDFDNFGLAEPALDVGRFSSALMETGIGSATSHEPSVVTHLDELCE
jgi:aminoglycoside phosphotransferase (APT) family kinase protein